MIRVYTGYFEHIENVDCPHTQNIPQSREENQYSKSSWKKWLISGTILWNDFTVAQEGKQTISDRTNQPQKVTSLVEHDIKALWQQQE